ncbi:MAG: nitroreductase family protein [Myxococcota bacterium]|jgi:nitroreductase
MKDDGKLGYKGTVTPLQKVMLARRSMRRYQEGGVSPEHVSHLLSVSDGFCKKLGLGGVRMRIFAEKADRDRIIRASVSNILGKTNPWLALTKAQAVIVPSTVIGEAPTEGDRRFAVAHAAMAMEAVVLAATGLGLGTVWLAAINHNGIERELGLPAGEEVFVISLLGMPVKEISLLSWDGLTYHMFSKRRKPLSEILFNGGIDNAYSR